MLSKRIIPCLDVREGRLTKGIGFKNNQDIGDPVAAACQYYQGGADEIVFYDITASAEKRGILIDVVKRVAERIFIPLSVGGGIRSLEDMRTVIGAGAEKVSINTEAVLNPALVETGARAFGSQCLVLGMDVKRTGRTIETPSGYEVVIHGGRTCTGRDALAWAKEAADRGAGEICLNSIDADGTREGYDLELTWMISSRVSIPVIASGGAGRPEHLASVLTEGGADAALVASLFHYKSHTISGLKNFLHERGIPVRLL